MQLTNEGELSDFISRTTLVPIILGWAQQVNNASSQFSLCSETCFTFWLCDEASCNTLVWHAIQVLGE